MRPRENRKRALHEVKCGSAIGRDGETCCRGILSAPMTEMERGKDGLPIRAFRSAAELAEWLEENHATSDGLWLKIAKRGAGGATVSYSEAIDVALCFGWIDSQKAALDEAFWLQRFTRRKPGSKWSKENRRRASDLIERGEMRAAGLREVERAQSDGRWEAAYDGQRTASVPEDLRRRLEEEPRALAFFATLSSVNRYAILHRIQTAKRPETRRQRIEKFVAMLLEGKTIH